MKWRLLVDGPANAYVNMAVDKAILGAREEPTVRFYSWKPSAVSIGYFQGIEEEVDLERCRELGVDVVRRITGGGAVYHDSEVTYSIIVDDDMLPANIQESYDIVCSSVVAGLAHLGVGADYVPLNDIVVGGKKISGSAQTRRMHSILQHGTLLTDVDVDRMFSLLKVPDEKIRDKIISNVKERVTSLRHELDTIPSPEKIISSLRKGFEETFNMELVEGVLSRRESQLVKEYVKEFEDTRWNHMR